MPAPKLKKVHFMGIGGIGVSALAQYYLAKGYEVSGSDLVSSEITQALQKKGAKLTKSFPLDADLIIYSPAVPKDNPELQQAKKLGIKCLSYPEALGELTKEHFTIAVSGTHGKSTTTAMLSLILIKAGLDPTVIIGTKLKEFGDSNFRIGQSKYLVIEADEHFASFLNYWPKIIVLTNIEKDHLDYYKNLDNILRTFKEYIGHLPEDGVLVTNQDDQNIPRIIDRGLASIKDYSLKQPEAIKIKKALKVPGDHNVYDALAALTTARILKVQDAISFEALAQYQGAWRRFEILKTKPFILIADYGHHPTKVRVTLKATREKWPKKKIWCVYQPHQYQRTYYLFDDFVKVFREAPIDKIIITDIFDVAGREEKAIKQKVNSKKLVEAVGKPHVTYLPKDKIVPYLKKEMKSGGVLIVMGAGDIYLIDKEL